MKKVLAIILAALMLLSVVACGAKTETPDEGTEPAVEETKNLTMWLWTTDLEQYAQRWEEATGNHIDITYVQDTNDLLTKYQTSLGAQSSELDIIVGEANMLKQYFEAGWVASLEDFADKSEFNKIIDYVVDAGSDDDGVVRCLGYQATPGGVWYRADIAEKVFGTDDPAEIHEKVFKDYPTMIEAAKTLLDAGYCIFNGTDDLGMFASNNQSWIGKDGKVHISERRFGYLDAAKELYETGALSFNNRWTSTWYASMGGPIPKSISSLLANAGGAEWSEDFLESDEYKAGLEEGTVEVFGIALPTWGMIFMNSYAKDLAGEWRVTEGPCPYVNGGSWLGISEFSENKEKAWEFVKFVCLDDESAEWWATSQKDFVSLKSVDEAHANDEVAMVGGQKIYQTWLDIAEKVDYKATSGLYDRDLDQYFGSAVASYQDGTKTREEAIAMFWESVQTYYPDLMPDAPEGLEA